MLLVQFLELGLQLLGLLLDLCQLLLVACYLRTEALMILYGCVPAILNGPRLQGSEWDQS